jgi:hypothetical protein
MSLGEQFAHLGKQLIDNGVADPGTATGRPTLFTDRIKLVEDNDV